VNDWNNLILGFKDYSIFHTKEWAKLLIKSYKFLPTYFVVFENRELNAVVPMMEVKSWITGYRAVSLPFSDYCEPLFTENSELSKTLAKEIVDTLEKKNIKYIKFKTTRNLYPFVTEKYRRDLRHILKLDKNESDLLKQCSENTKRNIKIAANEKLSLKIQNDKNGIKNFYEMMCETRKKHGLPPQPFSFFQNLLDTIITEGYGDILFAIKNNTCISGAIYLKFGKKLLYKYGASYSNYLKYRGNHFVMWEAIKKYKAEGYEEFDFGETDLEHEGLKRFKLGWNAEELSIYTTKYSLKDKNYVPILPLTQGFHNLIFSHLPIFMLKIIGKAIYKHFS
jgi:lipid II:glycine glycyltransferase (peptidoglycan interpeptide bridge formation enzyme)